MNKSIILIALALALAVTAALWLRPDPGQPVDAVDPGQTGATPAHSQRTTPTSSAITSDAAAARERAVEEAHAKAAQGELGDAMAVLAPLAADGDEEAQLLMGELNVMRLEKQREERIDFLVKQLSSVPEENTAQRYAIVRELAQLKPRDTELQALRELYGELLIDEVEAGMLNQ